MHLQQQKIPVSIEDEMKKSYMDYAMSVIVGRALPDVRDGLKPVHRRILYAMNEMGNDWNKPHKKSARIVGDVIGKYHPHGDVAVYDTIVRMAQDFSMRYPLIDGQGNFGSVDGDPPAAMRYTEIRMTRLASELLSDIEKETVDFVPTYDNSLTEPTVLPSKLPDLLINGSSGIAVGMATNIPPHSLVEVIDGIIAMIEDPDISIDDLMELVHGPDFPTAGFICGKRGIKEAYRTGRGIIHIRARAIIERNKDSGKESIVISELPYQVNKARLIESIAELSRKKKIEGISELRDESDREGMRIVVELKRDEIAKAILNQLYQYTQMQGSFGIIILAIVGGQPMLLNLKEVLYHFLNHRKEIVTRRTSFELKKAENKAHILEGLRIALENLDEVIALIKASANPKVAKEGLISRFSLSDLQAQAILDMRLQRLTALEQEKIIEDYMEILKLIEKYKQILANERLVLDIIVEELMALKQLYGDERRTEIIEEDTEISLEDMIVEEDMVVTITHSGYIKRNSISLYRSQRRGGKGKIGTTTNDTDFVEHLFVASTREFMLFFTDKGKVFWRKVYEIPQAGRVSRGKAIVNLLNLGSDENISAILPVREFKDNKYVTMATRNGIIKKTPLTAYSNPRVNGIIAINIDEGDRLISVRLTDGTQDIFLGTKSGKSIRFKEAQIRSMGRVTRGVKGIKLAKDDELIGMEIINNDTAILAVTENGFGKRTKGSEYRAQGRGGAGVITIKATQRNGSVVAIKQVTDQDDLMLITDRGKIIRISAKGISIIGRNTQGVTLIDVDKEEKVVGVARLADDEQS
ncbi:MAG: DNA gyrase subunit A [Deltaproteobacteria bacterium CG12_big_fil_rev_8_21_14_0_65_43_10]|nr:MAG: DNA gyrase subunit A [Deltaproteobacteria bacterium CG2_30_43_15]PIQ44911.1 MAG: DNA gyrase subunit A [Deltaproteobacteria bacterium CG12_big_fil_rev_8_21_14_0_65_43_10]PIU85819.1 MAG: DNA gyrase subunit A [Deltaproteobacteria bacterium CG06_land_8_20_14_3_00_44_19]PIX22706.1 MAG: DNA gyrase subunit A [Deltaproteobacteria bacterium CG_4_8_14_3_um_filter_43_13]PIZ21079.1 MAG: DNA gyrase subunit A [Deltaproteobacteria bacterium CG_4_10_14_0_8_um_filter_43_12]HCX89138.1 DNA gyrase subunit